MGKAAGSGTRPALIRTIVEERWTSEALDHARERWSGAELAWETATWIVARDPEAGLFATASGITRSRTLHGAISIFMPTVTLLYRFDDKEVVVYDALFDAPTRWQPNAEG